MKIQVSTLSAIAGIALMPALATAQAVGTPSYQSLLAKNYALQSQTQRLQAQLRNLQAAKPPFLSYVPIQPRLYEFPITPTVNSQAKPVPTPPKYYNIPDCRVIPLGQ